MKKAPRDANTARWL